jgi:hypothetical protein
MNLWYRLKGMVKKQKTGNSSPLLITQKDSNNMGTKRYSSIEKAIADLENDANISKEKLEQIRKSLEPETKKFNTDNERGNS